MIKALIAVMAIAITAFYFFWNPASTDLLLVCPFKKMTGFYCDAVGNGLFIIYCTVNSI
jgi:hypothetical protein